MSRTTFLKSGVIALFQTIFERSFRKTGKFLKKNKKHNENEKER